MNHKEKIKSKVKALLLKTTSNGATESEAMSAIAKAHELMTQYFITEDDLIDPFDGEQCGMKSCPLVKSGYNTRYFYKSLSDLFDCEHFFSTEEIFFFGFEQDIDLCIYFYNMIIDSCFVEKAQYMKTQEYENLTMFHAGRTIVSSFIKGYLMKVGYKMERMFEERKSSVSENSTQGLMVIEKKAKVEDAFKEIKKKVQPINQRRSNHTALAFNSGIESGDKLILERGIGGDKDEIQRTLF